jgi:hypothetical protein
LALLLDSIDMAKPVFFVYQTLGRKEDSAALDAGAATQGLDWKRWSTKWLYVNPGVASRLQLAKGHSLTERRSIEKVP